MRRWRLLTGTMLALGLFATAAMAQDVSIFDREAQKMEKRYGIQATGGFGIFSMSDVNDYRLNATHQQLGNATNANLGIGGGFALLYRSHKKFRWMMGYNMLGQDRTEASWFQEANNPDTYQYNEHSVTGSEFYIAGNYMLRMGEALHIYLGGGPALYTGTLDRNTSGAGFFDATGRGLGLRAHVGFELMFGGHFGITALAGYRQAYIPKIVYENQAGAEVPVYWNANTNRQFSIDFSGPFAEAGIRYYFKPATEWFKL